MRALLLLLLVWAVHASACNSSVAVTSASDGFTHACSTDATKSVVYRIASAGHMIASFPENTCVTLFDTAANTTSAVSLNCTDASPSIAKPTYYASAKQTIQTYSVSRYVQSPVDCIRLSASLLAQINCTNTLVASFYDGAACIGSPSRNVSGPLSVAQSATGVLDAMSGFRFFCPSANTDDSVISASARAQPFLLLVVALALALCM